MSTKRKYFVSSITLLATILTFQSTVSLSPNCRGYSNGTILDCVSLDGFPNGSYEAVRIIKFCRNNFRELQSYVFINHSLYNVQKAILRHSNIRVIHPDAFAQMQHLNHLDLGVNKITALGEKSFNGLQSLTRLVLAQNQLSSIDVAVLTPLVSLDFLDISYNHIEDVSKDLLKHKNITELNLSHNDIRFPTGAAFLESHSLQKLALQDCSLEDLPSTSFNGLDNLLDLDLSKNHLKHISKRLLKPLIRLQKLDITGNKIKSLNVDSLPTPNNIEHLICDDNPLEEDWNCARFLNESKTLQVDAPKLLHKSLVIETDSNNNEDTLRSKEKKTENKDVDIELLQYWMLLGLSIGLIVLVIILLLLSLYIAKQNKIDVLNREALLIPKLDPL